MTYRSGLFRLMLDTAKTFERRTDAFFGIALTDVVTELTSVNWSIFIWGIPANTDYNIQHAVKDIRRWVINDEIHNHYNFKCIAENEWHFCLGVHKHLVTLLQHLTV